MSFFKLHGWTPEHSVYSSIRQMLQLWRNLDKCLINWRNYNSVLHGMKLFPIIRSCFVYFLLNFDKLGKVCIQRKPWFLGIIWNSVWFIDIYIKYISLFLSWGSPEGQQPRTSWQCWGNLAMIILRINSENKNERHGKQI